MEFRKSALENTHDALEMEVNETWEETWDPMDVYTPLVAFQPYHVTNPVSLCTYREFELFYPEEVGRDYGMQFEPDATDKDVWDPMGHNEKD